jgi:capsular polysaccharide biosynthesis protein
LKRTQVQAVQTPGRSPAGFLRRESIVILACVALGGAAGGLITAAQHDTYAATATLLATATGVDTTQANARTTGIINLDTEAQLVKSAAVAARAKHLDPSLSSAPASEIVKNVRVSVPANTTVLKIAYSAPTAQQAQSGANAFATAYLADRKATAQALLTRQIGDAQASVASLTAKLKTLASSEAVLPPRSRERIFDAAQRSLYTSQILTLNQQLVGYEATQITPGRLLTPATRPGAPSSPSRVLDVGSGLGAGLLVGLLLAWLRTTHRRTVRRGDDLAHGIDLPTLAVVRAQTVFGSEAAGHERGAGESDRESYRRLAVLVLSSVQEPATVVVSSARAGRSGRAVAGELAAALATTGTPVCLLDVGPEGAPKPMAQSVYTVHFDRADARIVQPGSGSMKESLDQLRGEHGILVAATPSTEQMADALILAAVADAVLLVVDSGTRMAAVRRSLARFDELSAPMLGAVLVRGKRLRRRRDDASDTTAAPDELVARAASDRSHGHGTGSAAEPDGVAATAGKRAPEAEDAEVLRPLGPVS